MSKNKGNWFKSWLDRPVSLNSENQESNTEVTKNSKNYSSLDDILEEKNILDDIMDDEESLEPISEEEDFGELREEAEEFEEDTEYEEADEELKDTDEIEEDAEEMNEEDAEDSDMEEEETVESTEEEEAGEKAEMSENENYTPVYNSYGGAAEKATYIAEDMVIIGEISAKRSIVIAGKIKGNVETEGNLTVDGEIEGNVTGADITLGNCTIKGDLISNGRVNVNSGAVLIGNLIGKNINVLGKIKGEISVDESASFRQQSLIVGNISAGSIEIETGAIIKGQVTTTKKDEGQTENVEQFFNFEGITK